MRFAEEKGRPAHTQVACQTILEAATSQGQHHPSGKASRGYLSVVLPSAAVVALWQPDKFRAGRSNGRGNSFHT